MSEPITPRGAFFSETHLGITTQYKLAPELDRYLLGKGIEMGGGADHTEILYDYQFPLAEQHRG